MEDNTKIKSKDAIADDKLKNVTGGDYRFGHSKYTCVNPNCSEYLNYLQFQPENNRCTVCGCQMGIVV